MMSAAFNKNIKLLVSGDGTTIQIEAAIIKEK